MCYVVLIDTYNSFYSLSACLNPHIIYSYFFCGNCCVLGEKLTGRILEITWLSTFSLSLNFVFVLQIIQPLKYPEHFFKFCYKWKFIHSAHMSWVKSFSRVRLLATPWTTAYQALHPWDFPGKSTGVGCHCLLQ